MLKMVHPGIVISKNDHQRHHISYYVLCRLYKLSPYAKGVVNAEMGRAQYGFSKEEWDNAEHFYPRADGQYPLFEKESDQA